MKQVNRNSLLIIGNGFDMSLGLDSSFTDFFGIEDGTYHILNSNLNEFIKDCKDYDKNSKSLSSRVWQKMGWTYLCVNGCWKCNSTK